MAKEPDNIVLEHLRVIRADVAEVKDGIARLDLRMASIESHVAGFGIAEVRQNSELDRLRERLTRIERRLELADGE